ncbi:hypothetical protein SeMB42_g06623 [Synchytrium endobioticum]|uniref:Uncharacterized protein n=1 Tax=Synchytrium endobioticum TaxID=286115 RepID=A0A507CHA1_9FUNG|nr:hypothetical protein SeMB42_g06623 [Synchytrium endobioticum]
MNVGAMYANSDIPDVGKAKHKKVFSRRHKGGITRIQCRRKKEMICYNGVKFHPEEDGVLRVSMLFAHIQSNERTPAIGPTKGIPTARTEAEEEAFKLGYGVQAVYWLLDGHQNWITLDYSAFALVTQHHLII